MRHAVPNRQNRTGPGSDLPPLPGKGCMEVLCHRVHVANRWILTLVVPGADRNLRKAVDRKPGDAYDTWAMETLVATVKTLVERRGRTSNVPLSYDNLLRGESLRQQSWMQFKAGPCRWDESRSRGPRARCRSALDRRGAAGSVPNGAALGVQDRSHFGWCWRRVCRANTAVSGYLCSREGETHIPISAVTALRSPTGLGRAARCHNKSIRLPIARNHQLEGRMEQSNGRNE